MINTLRRRWRERQSRRELWRVLDAADYRARAEILAIAQH